MLLSNLRVLNFILILTFTIIAANFLKFTNIKCTEFDPKFAIFNECRLKILKRNTVGMNIYVKVFQLPINNISFNLALLKKANGYKPFMYNITNNFCKYMKYQNQLSFSKIFFDILKDKSNINHTCPYNHDIVVRNLVLQNEMFKYLPLPMGAYMYRLKIAVYNEWKTDVKAYFELIESKPSL